MTDDLPAIDMLAKEWDDAYDEAAGDQTDNGFMPRQDYFQRGDRILAMYEAEAAKFPDDADVKAAMSAHLAHLANNWYGFVKPEALHPKWDTVLGMDSTKEIHAIFAGKACQYAVRSFSLVPNVGATMNLSMLFAASGFTASAVYWLTEMERVAAPGGQAALEARAKRLELTAGGPPTDPAIGPKAIFPKRDTPGLVLANQPASPPPAAPAPAPANTSASGGKGGCFVATACYGNYDHPDVLVFRRLRDQRLLPHPGGSRLVSMYYRLSPRLAARIERMPWLRNAVRRWCLEPFARILRGPCGCRREGEER